MRSLNVARSFHVAVALPTGRVLLIGGTGPPDEADSPRVGRYGAMAELF